ncbi:hypothetical protein TNCV_2160381 [Trichonephila clavipes]|nr:hypothetical protein TNCV_2160381 [Trichonephila clavipes]
MRQITSMNISLTKGWHESLTTTCHFLNGHPVVLYNTLRCLPVVARKGQDKIFVPILLIDLSELKQHISGAID